jgi:4-hydroxy-tetrahydrodipicolinate synthase
MTFVPEGVIPAVLLPFLEDLSIDEGAYRQHLRYVASTRGLSALTTNAHSSEVASCTFEEQVRVLEVTLDEVGDQLPIVNGIYADGSLEAARLARMADVGGASALLVFPPNPFSLGAQSRPEMAIKHFEVIAEATDLPIIVFQYPLASGQGYPLETLLQICDAVPSVFAIKDWCNNVQQHERQIQALQSLARPVNVLTTHSSWLLSSLVLGCKGLLSGSGSVIADLQVALFNAIRDGRLDIAKDLNERIRATADVFYADPFVDMHNRMKVALVALGRIPSAAVRPPLVPLDSAETMRIADAMTLAGIAPEGAILEAA